MHGLHPLIFDLMLITVFGAVITIIFKKLKQPIVLGYLFAGILAGPHFDFLPTISDRANIAIWADIGVIFLLFSLGLEFSFKKMISVGKSALLTACLNIFLLLFFGYYVGLFLGWNKTESLFLGAMISMSSTTVIIKAFEDLQIKKQKSTDLVLGVLIIEDVMGIMLLAVLPSLAYAKNIGSIIGLNMLKLSAFLMFCFVLGMGLVPIMLRKLSDFLSEEILLLVSIALLLSTVCLAVYFGFSSALGAFMMGSILAETALMCRIENVIKPLKDLFGAVFFVTVGMMVDLEMFINHIYPILVITVVVVVCKIFLSVFGFFVSGQNLKTSILGGFALAQVGEFAFIIATLGINLGVLKEFIYPIIVAVSVVTTFLTPVMIKSAPKAYQIMSRLLDVKNNFNKGENQ